MSNDKIFYIKEIDEPLLEKANIYKSIVCYNCQELTTEYRIHNYQNKNLCMPCYEKIRK